LKLAVEAKEATATGQSSDWEEMIYRDASYFDLK
jgi:hypothetical protein